MRTVRLNHAVVSPGEAAPTPEARTDDQAVRRETEDGVEYVVAETTPAREGVYYYETEDGRIAREYLPDDELTANAEQWEGYPVTMPHPTNSKGESTLLGKGSAPTVGEVRSPRANSDENGAKIQSETWLDTRERGKHDGEFAGVLDRLERGETVETSIGYEPTPRAQTGVFDGESYEYVQEDIQPDHLAVLPDSEHPGNCSVADGCGIGRLNHEMVKTGGGDEVVDDLLADEDSEGALRTVYNTIGSTLGLSDHSDAPRTNESTNAGIEVGTRVRWEPDEFDADDGDTSRYGAVLPTVFEGNTEDTDMLTVVPYALDVPDDPADDAERRWQPTDETKLLNSDHVTQLDQFPPSPRTNDSSGSGSDSSTDPTDSDEGTDTSTATSGRDTTDDENSKTMNDEEKIETLVEQHDLDRENIAPLEGENCLDTIYQKFEGEVAADGGSSPNDGEGGNGSDGGEGGDGGRANVGEMKALKEELVEAAAEAGAEAATATIEEQRTNERKDELTAQIAAAGEHEEERLNDMSVDALEIIAEQQDGVDSGGESRTNMAGVPQDVTRDTGDLGNPDTSDTPSGEWGDYSDSGNGNGNGGEA